MSKATEVNSHYSVAPFYYYGDTWDHRWDHGGGFRGRGDFGRGDYGHDFSHIRR